MEEVLATSFRTVFDHLDHEAVRAEVDAVGFDRFVEESARLAGVTGAVAGLGGALTMIVGLPASIINNVAQQFRVTLAAVYVQQGGDTAPDFDAFMRVVGRSLGLDLEHSLTNSVLITIAHNILARLGASAAGAMIPVLGAFIGGGLSYGFIKGIGRSLKALDLKAGPANDASAGAGI